MGGGSQKKTCPNCNQKIYCSVKICNLCQHPQPRKMRLKRKIEKFKSQQSQWVSSIQKNNTKSHVLDTATILLEKLYALDLKPLLLIAHPPKKTAPGITKVMLPNDAHLSTSAKTCLEDMEVIFQLMVEGWTKLDPPQEPLTMLPPQGPCIKVPKEEETLMPCDPSETSAPLSPHRVPFLQEPAHQTPSTTPPQYQDPSTTLPQHQDPSTMLPQYQHPSTTLPQHQDPSTTLPQYQHPSTTPPQHQDPLTKPPQHQDLSTKPPQHQDPSPTPPQHQDPSPTPPQHHDPSTKPPQYHDPSTTPPQYHDPSIQAPAHPVQTVLPPSRNRRQKIKVSDCPHNKQSVFPVRGVIKTRKRKGKTELLLDWQPCDLCGKKWPPSWQQA